MRKLLVLVVTGALMLTGCVYTGDPIPDDDVARWQTTADQALPGATEVKVYVDDVVCMTKCGEELYIDAKFATYQDAIHHEDELLAFQQLIDSDDAEYPVQFHFDVADLDEVKQHASDALVAAMGGDLVAAEVRLGNPQLWESGIHTPGYLSLYVENQSTATPQLLSAAMDAATADLGERRVSIDQLLLSTEDGVGLNAGQQGFDRAVIHPQELRAFMSTAVGDCVVEGQWAFDITTERVVPYPADFPGGACAM